jgi:hypothetical protein
MNIKITKAVVLLRPCHTDAISLTTELPMATYPYEGKQFLTFNAEVGKGVEYVKNNFGIDPEVVDLNSKDVKVNQGRVQIYSGHDGKGESK